VSIRTSNVFDSEYEGQDPSSDSLATLVFVALLSLVAAARPEVLTSHRMDVIHALLMGKLMWQVLTTASVYNLVFGNVRMTSCRIFVGLWHGNVPLTSILNLLYSCASSWNYASLMKSCVHCGEQFGPLSELWYAVDSCFVTLVVTAVAYAMEFRTLKEVRAVVRAKLSSQAETTVNTLLLALCDSVIHLSGDFSITAGARTLETLLLKTRGSLVATSFLDVLEETDRARFCEHIQDNQKRAHDSPAALLHVHARGSHGTRVSLQIFSALFTDINDNVGYLLGILETSREEYGEAEVADTSKQILDMRRQLRLNESAPRSPSSATSCVLPLAISEDSPNEATIWFDAATLLVLRTTPACTTIAGPSCEGTDLKSWLEHPGAFIEQVQLYCKVIVDMYEDGNAGTPITHFKGVKLQPEFARKAHIEYLVDVTLSAEEENILESDSSSNLTMRAVFTNITQQRRSKREARGHVRQSQRSTQQTQHGSECQTTSRSSTCGHEGKITDAAT